MPVEKHFIKQGIKRVQLETYLQNELSKAGYGGVDIKRVLTGTRVTIYVERPGMVIGKKGKSIKQLTDDLEQKFGLEKPQVEVVEIPKPELSGPIMAKHIAFALERGLSVRRVGQSMVRTIMGAGARGVEIVISGRIAGERSRSMRFYEGYLSKAGEPAQKLVSHGKAVAKLKPGIVGIKVSIMPPDVPLPGEIKIAEETTGTEKQPAGEKVEETKVKKAPEEGVGDGDAQA
ncbi:MAG: 30S ribosomal protein S3 [Candidatus Hadarchaeum sp.]|uniref:30S ribosomal protein S3 n=1 Tax=Candidatus Hadarchaeum sp. TaxID=2883567 RepID=UPI003181223F